MTLNVGKENKYALPVEVLFWISYGAQKIMIWMHRITPEYSWTLKGQMYSVYIKYLPPSCSHFCDTILLKIRKSEMHRMTPDWSEALNSQNYPVNIKYLLPTPKFSSVSLYNLSFSRYKVAENLKFLKCAESSQTEFWDLNTEKY